jgi:hypothetical protein
MGDAPDDRVAGCTRPTVIKFQVPSTKSQTNLNSEIQNIQMDTHYRELMTGNRIRFPLKRHRFVIFSGAAI